MTAIASFEPCQCHISGLERERVDPRQVEQCPVLQSHACMIGLLRLQLCGAQHRAEFDGRHRAFAEPLERQRANAREQRSEEHTSELQSLMRISYAVFCLKKKKK